MSARAWRAASAAAAALATAALLAGCTDVNNMRKQPRYKALAMSPLFPDSGGSRPDPLGSVARLVPGDRAPLTPAEVRLAGGTESDRPFSAAAISAPQPITPALLARGRERFDIFCSPCHGRDGYGEGLVMRRGFPQPPTFHSPRLRQMADAEVEQVITGGRGKMPPYGPFIPAGDRWAIVAFLRALQLSQDVPASALPDSDRAALGALPAEVRP